MRADRCGDNSGQKFHEKGNRRESKIKDCSHKEAKNVEHEMSDYTCDIWSHRNINKSFKEKFGSHTCKHSTDSLQNTVAYIWNITYIMESTAG